MWILIILKISTHKLKGWTDKEDEKLHERIKASMELVILRLVQVVARMGCWGRYL